MPWFGTHPTGNGEPWKDSHLWNLSEVPRMDDWGRTALDTDRARWEAASSDLFEVKMMEAKTNLEEWQGG